MPTETAPDPTLPNAAGPNPGDVIVALIVRPGVVEPPEPGRGQRFGNVAGHRMAGPRHVSHMTGLTPA